MRLSIAAFVILGTVAICLPAGAQEFVPSVPGDGVPDFYYFDVDSVMPEGVIYAGEPFPAGTFVIDPDGPNWGLTWIDVYGPPPLEFDDSPNPARDDSPRHINAGSILTAAERDPGLGLYYDTLLAEDLFDFYALRAWFVVYLSENDDPKMQLGMKSGPPLMSLQKDGEPFEPRTLLTQALIYEGGIGRQFGNVSLSTHRKPHLVSTNVTIVVPEPCSVALLILGGVCFVVYLRRASEIGDGE